MIYFELFYTFFLIGLFTFGGGYAMIPMITTEVTAKGWLSSSDVLSDFIAISEATPGPFAINIATFIGSEVGGIFGSLCATIGVILPSLIIIILVAWILGKFMNSRFVKGALKGVQPVVLGLILATAVIFFIKNIFFSNSSSNFVFNKQSLTLFILLFSMMFIYKKVQKKNLNPIIMLLIAAGLGILIFA